MAIEIYDKPISTHARPDNSRDARKSFAANAVPVIVIPVTSPVSNPPEGDDGEP